MFKKKTIVKFVVIVAIQNYDAMGKISNKCNTAQTTPLKMRQQKVLGMVAGWLAGDPVSLKESISSLEANWRYLNIAINIQTVILAGQDY